MSDPVLHVRELRVEHDGPSGARAEVVRGVELELHRGRALALVGESGCGKSTVALAIPRLIARRGYPEEGRYSSGGRILSGQILLDGIDLMRLTERELQAVRGAEIGLVFQEPTSALNPVMPVLDQVAEPIEWHARVPRREARLRARELLERFGLALPGGGGRVFPHELSGGMRQRVVFASALAAGPRVLIADEPTASLDVTVQADLLRLLDEMQRESGLAVLWISHDLSVVAHCADEVALMYAGAIVETGPADVWFAGPRHPYGAALQAAIPASAATPPEPIPGSPPDPWRAPSGCRFRTRCGAASNQCGDAEPALSPVLSLHGPVNAHVACYHPRGEAGGG